MRGLVKYAGQFPERSGIGNLLDYPQYGNISAASHQESCTKPRHKKNERIRRQDMAVRAPGTRIRKEKTGQALRRTQR